MCISIGQLPVYELPLRHSTSSGVHSRQTMDDSTAPLYHHSSTNHFPRYPDPRYLPFSGSNPILASKLIEYFPREPFLCSPKPPASLNCIQSTYPPSCLVPGPSTGSDPAGPSSLLFSLYDGNQASTQCPGG